MLRLSSHLDGMLDEYARRVPRPGATLAFSCAAGVLIIALYRVGNRLGWSMPMYRKEGFLENLTFFLECWASVLCGIAANRTRRARREGQDLLIVIAYWLCAAILFVVAMEEISWGQQLIVFRTPEAWREVNHQGEFTLHNLASRSELTLAWKLVGVGFFIGVLGLCLAARRLQLKVLRFIAPPLALVPLAGLIAFAAVRVHPEVAEVLMSIFFAFYGYRIYVASWPAPTPENARR